MEREDAVTVVAYLTSMTTGWNDDSTEAMVYEIEQWADAHTAMSAARKVALSWERSSRPPVGILHDAYMHELRVREMEARSRLDRTGTIRCDGYGWYDRGQGRLPCPTCNRGLHEVWHNVADGIERWRQGESLRHVLGIDLDTWVADYEHLPCRQAESRDVVLSPGQGFAVARAAYEAEHGPLGDRAAAILSRVGSGV